MSDFIWFLITGILLAILGIILIRIGLVIWKKQKTEWIIRHHMDKVRDEHKQAYCRLCGIGILICGIGFAVSGVWMLFTTELCSWIPMAAGLVTGILILFVSVARYNR